MPFQYCEVLNLYRYRITSVSCMKMRRIVVIKKHCYDSAKKSAYLWHLTPPLFISLFVLLFNALRVLFNGIIITHSADKSRYPPHPAEMLEPFNTVRKSSHF